VLPLQARSYYYPVLIRMPEGLAKS
jgi:hypothetical protein